MNTKTERQWEYLVKIPNGHKFFRDKLTGKISVCDDSGKSPDFSDDGPLWVQTEKAIMLSEQYKNAQMIGSVPVIRERTGELCSTLASAREIIWLVRNLGMTIKIQTFNFDEETIAADDQLEFVAGRHQKQFVPLDKSLI